MATKKLKLIPAAKVDPKRMTIFKFGPDAKIDGSADGPDYVCGACGKPLVENSRPGMISGIVINCDCGAYNDATI